MDYPKRFKSKEDWFKWAAATNYYRVNKPLPPPLSYAKVGGGAYSAETLYDNGYNIQQLLDDGFIELSQEPFPFQSDLVGKNLRSVYSRCPECQSFGVNMPLDNECGNCGYPRCITYYDARTINEYLKSLDNQHQNNQHDT